MGSHKFVCRQVDTSTQGWDCETMPAKAGRYGRHHECLVAATTGPPRAGCKVGLRLWSTERQIVIIRSWRTKEYSVEQVQGSGDDKLTVDPVCMGWPQRANGQKDWAGLARVSFEC